VETARRIGDADRMRLTWLVPLALLIPACSDDVVQDPSTTSTNPGNTTSTGPVDPTTGGSVGTSEPGGSTSTGPQPTTDVSTSSEGTSTGTTDTSGSSSGESTDDSGPVLPGECMSAADCKLFEDCCECKGIPKDEDLGICKLGCDTTRCEAIAVDEAICRLGQCIAERLDCDSSKVLCLVIPPECPEGLVPGVDGDCWSGACIPGEICNVVPNCSYCSQSDWMCVSKIAFGPQSVTCEPIPADCMGAPSCACAGAVCPEEFSFCSEPGGNALNCECINC
jgi:hypothetical protein